VSEALASDAARELTRWSLEWADVTLTADAAIVPRALPLPSLTWTNLLRLAHHGGAVLVADCPLWHLPAHFSAAESAALSAAWLDCLRAARAGLEVVVPPTYDPRIEEPTASTADGGSLWGAARRLPESWHCWLVDVLNGRRLEALAWWCRQSGGFTVGVTPVPAPPLPAQRFAPPARA